VTHMETPFGLQRWAMDPTIGWLRFGGTTKRGRMDFEFTTSEPVTEDEALLEAGKMGLHALAINLEIPEDEELHWHEFGATLWLIEGEASLADEHGTIYEAKPGCRITAPAGWLHRALASPTHRLVIGADIPFEDWTAPLNKPPADLLG